ncbi:PREDICTED: mannose/glucose-specific lectin-like [Ipomoea nil]|uniref:mannose/glucose-specific lectin-like n=1 Tax=Ipomoea nil TaxID=35883 RepID=UPI000900D5B6|nr:PREDICTED: mannose/glucose-specific lectin-like [Ipomoea nil]
MAAVPMDTIAGPFGFSGGDFWSFRPVNKINQIVIHYASGNNPIALTFSSTKDDGSKDTITVGGAGPDRIVNTDTVNIDNADEYLVDISGTFGIYLDNNVLRSIKFTTNLKDYGPFGPNVGEPFSPVRVVPNKIVGFLGRSGFYIDAIGTYNSNK